MSDTEFQIEATPCRRTYLITYSQINLELFPTRSSFADAVVNAFKTNNATTSPVLQFAVCKEPHEKGSEHYHMCLT